MTKANNTRKPKECRITDVDRNHEAVYVYFGELGQAACYIENCRTMRAIVDTPDSLEPSDTLRVDAEANWTLRELDTYLYERIGASVDELMREDKQIAKHLGQWFNDYGRRGGYDSL